MSTQTVEELKERIAALEAKCDLLSASLKQSDKLVAAVQATLAKYHAPLGPSKADTIKALDELLAGSAA